MTIWLNECGNITNWEMLVSSSYIWWFVGASYNEHIDRVDDIFFLLLFMVLKEENVEYKKNSPPIARRTKKNRAT